MDFMRAIRAGDLNLVRNILSTDRSLISHQNENFANLTDDVRTKAIYCAECYQKIRRKPLRNTSIRGYVCDWPKHRRTVHKQNMDEDICCCDTPSGDLCNWMICPECFVISTYELKATHQLIAKTEGHTPLIAASCRGHTDIVALLLENDCDVNTADPDGVTALMAAASMGHTDVLRLLLDAGAELDLRDKEGRTALFRAVEVEALECVEQLLAAGASTDVTDETGATLLHAAASVGHVGLIRTFLDCGLDPNALEKDGCAPLHWLPCGCRAPALHALMDAGAEVNLFDKDGMTPLCYATMRDNTTLVRLLLQAGATMEVQAAHWYNCLYASCLFHAPKITEVLLEAGATMSAGQPSPLGLCAQRNLVASAEICLRYGVPGAGEAVEMAAWMGKMGVLKVLLQHWTGEGDMPMDVLHVALIHAARKDHRGAVKLLLDHGADPAYRHRTGRTVLDFELSKRMRTMLTAHLSGQAVQVDPEDEALVLSNREFMQQALDSVSRPWGRSKIMIVGDGRAGKTALANSIMGEEFRHTESTIGISHMTCEVKHAEIGGAGGAWEEYVKPDKELEAALAKIVAARRKEAGDMVEDDDSDGENASADGAGDADGAHDDNGNSGANGGECHARTSRTAGRLRRTGTLHATEDEEEEEGECGGSARAVVIDDDLVMKYLASMTTQSSKFVISLFDYGGQTVFNVIHHLFLTRYGVYTLVFNMEQLVSENVTVRENCLSTISFWLNSIIMHTYNAETGMTAPIFLVGTHKDIVSSSSAHDTISALLQERFGGSPAWPSVAMNVEVAPAIEPPTPPPPADNTSGDAAGLLASAEQPTLPVPPLQSSAATSPASRSLCFYPVDNRRGRWDSTVTKLMRQIETAIDQSDYVHAEHPLTWLRAMDRLTSCGRVYLTLAEVTTTAVDCGVAAEAVPALLTFLHEMGILMWHDDPALRDVVILDPVAYFVAPATTVICKHLSTAQDATRHVVEAHKDCNKTYYDAWMRLVHRGIASREVLLTLLKDSGDQADMVVQLMVKFGLIVPFEEAVTEGANEKDDKSNAADQHNDEEDEGFYDPVLVTPAQCSDPRLYLVPALLPPSPPSEAHHTGVEAMDASFLMYFTCSAVPPPDAILPIAQCGAQGFLPRGLFERLLCKIIAWCRTEAAGSGRSEQSEGDTLYQDYAVLATATCKLALRVHLERNYIAVTVHRGEVEVVQGMLCGLVAKIMSECMRSLRCFLAVPLQGRACGEHADCARVLPSPPPSGTKND